jgi:hypothetical protein
MKMILFAMLATLMLAGCVTEPKIDWAARVGHYSYEQGVLDLGPADKIAKLDNGVIVANWITRQGYAYTSVGAPVYGAYPGGFIMPGYTQGYSPTSYLRLTFGADGKLTEWKKYAQ